MGTTPIRWPFRMPSNWCSANTEYGRSGATAVNGSSVGSAAASSIATSSGIPSEMSLITRSLNSFSSSQSWVRTSTGLQRASQDACGTGSGGPSQSRPTTVSPSTAAALGISVPAPTPSRMAAVGQRMMSPWRSVSCGMSRYSVNRPQAPGAGRRNPGSRALRSPSRACSSRESSLVVRMPGITRRRRVAPPVPIAPASTARCRVAKGRSTPAGTVADPVTATRRRSRAIS